MISRRALAAALFCGLKSAVQAFVLQAVLRIGKRALKNAALVAIAALAAMARLRQPAISS